jgi:DNA-binding beta-propeller fold protein YncE
MCLVLPPSSPQPEQPPIVANQTGGMIANETVTSNQQQIIEYQLDRQWGSEGTGDGQFMGLYGIAFDSAGNVFIADGNNRIQKFDSDGNFITEMGLETIANSIAIDSSDRVYVTTGEDRIKIFAPSES